ADAVGREQLMQDLLDLRAVGLGVIESAVGAVFLVGTAVIGEPEAAIPVEHQIVRRLQRLAVAFRIEHFGLAGRDVDALDAPALVRGRRMAGDGEPVALVDLEIAAVVAAVESAAGPDGQAVGAAAGRGDDLRLAVLFDAGDAARRHLHHDHRAVVHGDGSFGKPQAGGDFADIHSVPSDNLGRG